MKRLLGKMPSTKSPSTGVAERVLLISVEKSSKLSVVVANVEKSKWSQLEFYDEEAIDLMVKLTLKCPREKNDSNIQLNISGNVDRSHHSESLLDIFKTALQTKGLPGLSQHLEKHWSLYLTNTGGQMEFQELLPLLVSGPSMFFVTFRLDQSIRKQYEIVYEVAQINNNTQSKSYKYTSSNTPLDTILQSLASIDAIGTYSYEDEPKKSVPLTYKVFLVGTHKDMLEKSTLESEIQRIDSEIKEAVKTASYYKHIVHATEYRLIYTVNNFADCEDDEDFQHIRSSVEQIVERGDFRMSCPSHWLIYSLVLRQLRNSAETFKKCFEIAQKCGISTEEELKEALHFMDRKMGVIRYFPQDDLKEVVILDAQVLFDKVTELIVETFTFEHCHPDRYVMDEFRKGIFSLEHFERISNKVNPDPLINPNWFAKLLQHLRIVAPFEEDGTKKYFFPCAISHVGKKQEQANQAVTEPHIPPLVVSFECGYCPIGLTGALIKCLMKNEVDSSFCWKLQTNGIFRDQVTFFFHATGDYITLRGFPTHLEIVCFPGQGNREEYPVKDTCVDVQRSVKKGIEIVTRDMNYIRNTEPTFTFYCTAKECKDIREHPAEVIQATGRLFCSKDNRLNFALPVGYQYWRGQGTESAQCEVQTQPGASTLLCLQSAFRRLLPLADKWQNIGTLLGVRQGKLRSIKRDEQEADNCLREMLDTWLKQTDPLPTWSVLAEVVEHFDPKTADEMRKISNC